MWSSFILSLSVKCSCLAARAINFLSGRDIRVTVNIGITRPMSREKRSALSREGNGFSVKLKTIRFSDPSASGSKRKTSRTSRAGPGSSSTAKTPVVTSPRLRVVSSSPEEPEKQSPDYIGRGLEP